MKIIKTFSLLLIFAGWVHAQAPAIDWQRVNIWPTKPDGSSQSQTASGEDWFYDIKIRRNSSGNAIGYAAAGYASYKGFDQNFLQNKPASACSRLSWVNTSCPEFRNGTSTVDPFYPLVGFFDLSGNNTHPSGHAFPIKQITGNAVGIIQSNLDKDVFYICGRTDVPNNLESGAFINYNPSISSPNDVFSTATYPTCDNPTSTGSYGRKGYVIKMKSDGTILWINLYGLKSFGHADAAIAGNEIKGLTETSNGDLVIYGVEGIGSTEQNFYLKRINSAGLVQWTTIVESSNTGFANGDHSVMSSVVSTVENGNEFFYVSDASYESSSNAYPFLTKVDNNGSVVWSNHYGSSTIKGKTTDLAVDKEGNLIMPILRQIGTTQFSREPGTGMANIYKINPSGTQISATPDFGPVKAYDLMMGVTPTSDGGFAIVSTKQNFSIRDNCTNTNFKCWGNLVGDHEFEYWNTNAFVAKYDRTMEKEWEKVFDAPTMTPYNSNPNAVDVLDNNSCLTNTVTIPNLSLDVKRQECLYRIVEAPDGGLVMCGNNSLNLDDCYIAKLNPDCSNQKTIENKIFTSSGEAVNSGELIIKSNTYSSAITFNYLSETAVHVQAGTHFSASSGQITFGIDPSLNCVPNYQTFANYKVSDVTNSDSEAFLEYEDINSSPMKVFPNPSDIGIMTVELSNGYRGFIDIEIMDVHGNQYDSYRLDKSNESISKTIDIQDLTSGVYLIRTSFAGDVLSSRFVKTK